ncbi:Uncharacterised protein [Mycobacteroides abscessus subsp. abscessus]|nr:Uncharacterised protein [Mycobacteroides abscessus subsp. abscessus]
MVVEPYLCSMVTGSAPGSAAGADEPAESSCSSGAEHPTRTRVDAAMVANTASSGRTCREWGTGWSSRRWRS